MKKYFVVVFILITAGYCFPQIVINKIEPPNWWTGMKLNKIQLMVYGENLNDINAEFNDPALKVRSVHKIENKSYAFIDVIIPDNLPAADYTLILSRGKDKASVTFPIYKKEKGKRYQGFSTADVIYLLMPDRFANGDTTNDKVPGYNDYMDTVKNQGRAGGDIQGMIDHLGYIKNFGATVIWATPLVENNTFRSYHGYAATDFYKIDPRLGTNKLYKKFVTEAHKLGLKIILDHVSNHFSDDHVWMKNPPTKDWTNGTKGHHLPANHSKMEFTDIHGDSAVIKQIEQGWFVDSMPDLNQNNPLVQNYIIQNTIWWVEYAGIDGIREDTYPYNNQKFMAKWAKAVMNEFPTLNIVGEVWTGEPAFLAGYQKNTFLPRDFNTNLPAITDFALRDKLIGYLQGNGSLYDIFNVFAKDYLYKDPEQLVTFADNHDLARVMFFANGNVDKAKVIYTILLTSRGIPAILYGSEIGMIGGEDHGELRMPFPGGFPNDRQNAFTETGRTDYENDIFNFLKELIRLRKEFKPLALGKLIHFPPVNDVYVYFKTYMKEKMMIVVNNNPKTVKVDLSEMKDFVTTGSKLENIKTKSTLELGGKPELNIDGLKAEIYRIF